MKNKRMLFVLVIIIAVLAIILTASHFLFSVKSFEIEKENNFSKLSENSIYEFLTAYKGDSILIFDEDALKEEMSLALPYANLLNVERIFPSTLSLNIEERTPFFAIYEDSQYYLFDSDNYYLGISTDRDIENSVILISGATPDNLQDMVEGTKVVFEGKEEEMEILNSYFSYMLTLDFEYTEFQTTYFLKKIEISFGNDISISTRLGVNMVIYDADSNLSEKVQYIMGAYSPDSLAVLAGQTIYIGEDLVPTLSNN